MKNKWIIILVVCVIFSVVCVVFYKKKNQITETNNNIKQIKIGDLVSLDDKDKDILRNETIKNISSHLKAPSTAEFEAEFKYICEEENIIKVIGWVDSQNSFGAMIRGKFECQYFAIDNDITACVYIKFEDNEILNIKKEYSESIKKNIKLEEIKKSGNELNQEKLEYIKNDYNSQKWNDAGEITKVIFNEKESIIDVKIMAKSSKDSNENKVYWTNFNVCSVLHYMNEFDIVGVVRLNIYDINNKKIVELNFDDEFLKNKWKNNSDINSVENLFGTNYKKIK